MQDIDMAQTPFDGEVAIGEQVAESASSPIEGHDESTVAMIGMAKKVQSGLQKSSTKPTSSYTSRGIFDPQDQKAAYESYADNLERVLDGLPDQEVALPEAADRLDIDHCVRRTRTISDMAKEPGRDNELVFVSDQYNGHTTHTAMDQLRPHRKTVTEHEALQGFVAFCERVEEFFRTDGSEAMAQNAKSLRENLTYIGGREHNEAARGIASYWKKQLDTNPDLKICILTGKKGNVNEGVVKSDDYLLEKVLDSFNDEELQTYGKRLLLDLPDEVLDSADNLKIVLLDDWSISGSQINSVYNYVIDRHKEYAHCLEINLVTAPKKKILNGFNAVGFDTHIIPVKAYFLARETEVDRRRQRTYSGTHITGSHSAVDYDFERVVTGLVTEWNRRHDSSQAITMPAPTNLVRPYRYDGYILEQRNRLHRIQQQLSL